jgi:ferric-dicitrate binding protein FerR (iron transport regulator)
MSWDDWRARLARLTEPTDRQLARVRLRVDSQLRSTAPLLREGGEPHPVQIARVRARIRAGRRPVIPGWAAPAFGALSAAAAVLFGLWRITAAQAITSVPLAGDLALTDAIQVHASGTGVATGAGKRWSLAWEQGEVSLEVAPGTGQQVSVRTREAEVRVIGTAFTVARDALGTAVSVDAGRVAVDCATGEHFELVPGASAECLPTTPIGLLARAHALAEAGGPPADQLASLDRALALAPDGTVLGEIRASRLTPLVALGRIGDARQEASAYLADADAPRAVEVRRLAGRLAITEGDCAAVAEHFSRLPDLGVEEAAWLARCTAP